jgi:hypothetical protein
MIHSTKSTNPSNNLFKIVVCAISSLGLMLGVLSLNNFQNLDVSAQSALPNTANLIIGTTNTSSSVELSVCLQSTSSSPMTLASVSNWFSYNSAALTPSATILQLGRYGVTPNNAGYGKLKWSDVPGANPTQGLTLSYSPDFGNGEVISSAPELFAKVKFDKIAGSTASTALTMTSNKFYSVQNTTAPIAMTISNVAGDCLNPVSTNSSSSSSSLSSSSQAAPTNNQPAGGGGVITICASSCPSTTSNTPVPAATANSTPVPKVTATSSGAFKSKLRITDPYVCGQGSYGNVQNPKQFGIDFVYFDLYRAGATEASYSFKLRIADNGDFFLPISKSTNVIKEGNYKVVFYAYDNEGNKAQGDYTDFISDNCANSKVVRSGNTELPRSGGLEMLGTLTLIISLFAAAYMYKKSSSKKTLKLKM